MNKNNCPSQAQIINLINSKKNDSNADLFDHIKSCSSCRQIYKEKTDLIKEKIISNQTFGKYKVIASIGKGGMGEVFKCYDPSLDRHVAIKVIKEEFSSNPKFMKKFITEAKLLAQLNHSNVIQIYDNDIQDNKAYLVMEYVDGDSLSNISFNNDVDFSQRIHLFKQILNGIKAAHKLDIVHRDIKPSNIMITNNNESKVLDFGISRSINNDQTQTYEGALIGTVAYMSPEIAKGEQASIQSDIYALGIVLYKLLTNSVPFESDTPLQTIELIKSSNVTIPPNLESNIPAYLKNIILKMCERDMNKRYITINEVLIDFLNENTINRNAQISNIKSIQSTITDHGIDENNIQDVINQAAQIQEEINQNLSETAIIDIADEMQISKEAVLKAIHKNKSFTNQGNNELLKIDLIYAIIFTILTCGLYNLYWNYKQMETCNILLGRKDFSWAIWFFGTLLSCGLYHIYYQFQMGAAIMEIQEKRKKNVFEYLSFISLIVTLFGGSVVIDIIHQLEINKILED
jgi:serine/threonine protein kinase